MDAPGGSGFSGKCSVAVPLGFGMIVTVNGKAEELPAGSTLRQLIERAGLGDKACAAEVNKQLVPRKEHTSRQLKDGDVVELVSLVGGG